MRAATNRFDCVAIESEVGMKKRQIVLASVIGMSLIAVESIALLKARASNHKAGAGRVEIQKARLSERVSVQAAGRGNPYINLSDGHELVTSYEGPKELVRSLESNEAQGLSLASGDFDEDGVPDLVSGYASVGGGGIITLMKGNVDAIYPTAPEAKQRKAEGTFTDAPFLSPARVFRVLGSAHFIGAGEFDGDGHWDVVSATRGESQLHFLSGDGHGAFKEPRDIE